MAGQLALISQDNTLHRVFSLCEVTRGFHAHYQSISCPYKSTRQQHLEVTMSREKCDILFSLPLIRSLGQAAIPPPESHTYSQASTTHPEGAQTDCHVSQSEFSNSYIPFLILSRSSTAACLNVTKNESLMACLTIAATL